ncbi:MAG: hypothetical protein IJP48_06230 [Synergistaceae bacterium]|nr:hypothetical protein [Synergistaceae bacterium]
MTEKRNHNNAGTMTAAARSAYEGKVGLEAVARAGRNPNLKGIVHEVLVRDAHNVNPANIFSGKAASLTKSAATVLASISAAVWIPAAIGVGAAVAVGSVVKGIWDSIFD